MWGRDKGTDIDNMVSVIIFVFFSLHINSLKTRLSNLCEVVIKNIPGDGSLVPQESEIDPKKLSSGANVTTDTCNTVHRSSDVF